MPIPGNDRVLMTRTNTIRINILTFIELLLDAMIRKLRKKRNHDYPFECLNLEALHTSR